MVLNLCLTILFQLMLSSIQNLEDLTKGASGSMNTIRLRGYSIRVSNSSNVAASLTDPCFTDHGLFILPTVIQEECKRTTKYIWIYQSHVVDLHVPILEICEVQIFGCETGTYGINCTKICSHCKNSKTCDIDSGECDGNGCASPGHLSPMCTECVSGLYGSECNSNCSQFCHKTSCYQTTGEFVNGCEDGYVGDLCTIPCPNGYFGRKCLETCSKCLNDQTCDNVNGTCMDRCDAGFKGEQCQIGVSKSTQDPDTPYIAVIAVLVGVIVVLIIIIIVGVMILRNARKKKGTNRPVNDIDMYDLPNAKPENSVYDVISSQ